MALPCNTSYSWIFREAFSCPGSSVHVVRNVMTGGREAVTVALARPGESRLEARFDIHVSPDGHLSSHPGKHHLTAAARSHYLRSERDIQTESSAVAKAVSGLEADGLSRSALLERVFEYCSENISLSRDTGPFDAESTLRHCKGNTLGRARAMVALCRASRLPARIVTGFVLDKEPQAQPHIWVEAYIAKEWVPYDPENGFSGELPPAYVPARRDGIQIVEADSEVNSQARFSIRHLPVSPGPAASGQRGPGEILDLTRLSPSMQRTLALLLLAPVGALVTTIFRNLIGVQTFGTFTPILIALSFVHADWRTGLMVLLIVVIIGLAGRASLNSLKLLTVPRLSVVLTLVVLCLTMAISLLDYFRLTPAAQAVLLPMVILTMTVERFHISAEEDGFGCALKVLVGTLAVAFCSFAVLRLEGLGELLLSFPEGEFIIAAVLILIGRYTGYRLTELWRFRDIADASYTEGAK